MVRKWKRLLLPSMLLLAVFCSAFIVNADQNNTETVEMKKKAVVYLLDASGSMNSNDPGRLAIDSVAQLVYSLPSNYLTAVFAYNNEVVFSTGLMEAEGRGSAIRQISGIGYTGYTNAGDALAQASGLLRGSDASEKTIVILSDGEIDMKTPAETARSSEVFQAAVTELADQGIKVHVMGLGNEMEDREVNIFSAAERTGGIRMELFDAEDIPGAIERILVEQLDIKKSTGAVINASGAIDTLSVELPFQNAEKLRILLTSTGRIHSLITDFHAVEVKQENGTYYYLVEITNPSEGNINFQLQGEAQSQIKVDLIPEYRIASVPVLMEPDGGPEKRFFIQFYDRNNQNKQLFTNAFFHNARIGVKVNEAEEYASVINDGKILLDFPVEESRLVLFEFDFTDFPVNVLDAVSAGIEVEVLEEIPEPDLRPWVILGIVILLILTALLLVLRHRKKKVITLEKEQQAVITKNSYVGNLSLYITRSAYDYDIPPLAFNLFRLPAGQEISLRRILDMCGVEEYFEGADKILFQPGAGRSLIVTNQSDCTILRNREILMKGKSYQILAGAKVDITFEDERSELVLQYKDTR